MTESTLKITFRQADEHRTAARERLEEAEAGGSSDEIEQDVCHIVNFEEFDDIDWLMRRSNLELIEAIVTQHPESIRQATAVVDRDYREVHRNLKELEALGVVEFDQASQSKTPKLRGGVDNIDFSIRFPMDGDSNGTTAAV